MIPLKEIKAVSHNIKSIDNEQWEKESPQILKRGITAKFSQNSELAKALTETGIKTIIEASADKFWGVGLTLRPKDLFDKAKWPGKNTLCEILMQVRKELADK